MARDRHGKKPGSDIPNIAGAKILGGDGQARPMLPPRTIHTTDFQSCQVHLAAITDMDDVVQGYQIMITDPLENHTYTFKFEQSVRDHFKEILAQFPDIGEKVPVDE